MSDDQKPCPHKIAEWHTWHTDDEAGEGWVYSSRDGSTTYSGGPGDDCSLCGKPLPPKPAEHLTSEECTERLPNVFQMSRCYNLLYDARAYFDGQWICVEQLESELAAKRALVTAVELERPRREAEMVEPVSDEDTDDWADAEEWDWSRIDALIAEWGSGPEAAREMTQGDILRAFDEALDEEAASCTTAIGRARRVAAEVAVSLLIDERDELRAWADKLLTEKATLGQLVLLLEQDVVQEYARDWNEQVYEQICAGMEKLLNAAAALDANDAEPKPDEPEQPMTLEKALRAWAHEILTYGHTAPGAAQLTVWADSVAKLQQRAESSHPASPGRFARWMRSVCGADSVIWWRGIASFAQEHQCANLVRVASSIAAALDALEAVIPDATETDEFVARAERILKKACAAAGPCEDERDLPASMPEANRRIWRRADERRRTLREVLGREGDC